MALTIVALYLFTRDRIPLEGSALAILIALVLSFQVFPYTTASGQALATADFLSGFGHEALVTICALMMIGKALETTGALQPVVAFLARAWLARPALALFATLVLAAVLSAFLNNTPIVVMLLPMLIGVAVRTKLAPSAILMPVGLVTIIGGMATSIGTSTNLLVVSIAADLGQPRMSMFEFTLPVVIVGSVGLLYLWFVAPKLLPNRKPPMVDTSPRVFSAQLYISEDSAAFGKSFSQVLALTNNEMRVTRIQRGEGLFVAKLPSVVLQDGDRLLVRDTPENLKLFEKQLGATLHDETGTHLILNEEAADKERQQMAEIVVTQGSLLHRQTLNSTRFPQRYRLLPLAIHRAREPGSEEVTADIGKIQLRAGDVLLMQGTREQIVELKRAGSALVLDGTTDLPRTHRAKRASFIMALVVVAAALGVLPISVSAVAGVGLMLVTRCLSWEDLGSALSAPVVMIIVTSLALGLALTATGGALFIAQAFVALVSGLSVPFVLSGLMLVMAILTNVVSNNAAGVIGTPIAIHVATELGVDIQPFILAVIFGANMSFATPFGYQTNLLLLSAGGYTFSDFMRVGIPLTILMWLGFSLLLPVLYTL
jgi:di/tricarboxylate transporter